jgi:hypothetical protein
MSNLNYTPERLSDTISEAEQLSLALIMLFDQKLDEDQLRTHIKPLLIKLNDDLQEASAFYLLLMNQGGMGSPHEKRS